MSTNPQIELARHFVEGTNKNIFLTGKAGTGKTTFLKTIQRQTTKRCVVVAPTGVAAINAGGMTIHSFFQMPFGPHLPREVIGESNSRFAAGHTRMSKTKIDIIKSLDLLIIDEISMVRADLLDGIDEVLRRYKDRNKAFGGVQLLMIGDIQQLSPVVKDEDWNILRPYYETLFFYGSRALRQTDYISIELKHIYRQSDKHFIDLLNSVRENKLDKEVLKTLNNRYVPNLKRKDTEGYIMLTTHNAKAREINDIRLKDLPTPPVKFTADVEGEFPEYSYPTDYELVLKKGSQVMFVKNDPGAEKLFYNGKIGTIEEIDEEESIVYVRCDEDNSYIPVSQISWENCRYDIHPETKEIEETVVGKFIQIPLKLAWSITIHKSQGLTFDRAVIDARDSFAHGQVYVALSRCRTLEGLILSTPLETSSVRTDGGVKQFMSDIVQNEPDETRLKLAKLEFEQELIAELFDFGIIGYRINGCMKSAIEHKASLINDLSAIFTGIKDEFSSQVIQVSHKFKVQLIGINKNNEPNREELIQERIQKASVYFIEKLQQTLSDKLDTISIDTDNKEAKKAVKELVERLLMEVHIKKACLEAAKKGFSVKTYLDARAKASIDKISLKTPINTTVLDDYLPTKRPKLFSSLREWRDQKAYKEDVIEYRIFSQKTLTDIANMLPASLPELIAIKGIGKKKAKKYGTEILKVIAQWCADNQVEYAYSTLFKDEPKKKKKDEPHSREISFGLFKQGKTVKEIADERGFAISTIEGHLSYFVNTGELEIEQLVSKEQIQEIVAAIEESGFLQLNPLREFLEGKYDYGTLRIVTNYYQKNQEKTIDSTVE